MIKICLNCNCEFEGNEARKYCCIKCSIIATKEIRAEQLRNKPNWAKGLTKHTDVRIAKISQKMQGKGYINRIKKSCLFCENEFEIYPNSKRKFCSRKCGDNFKKGKPAPWVTLNLKGKKRPDHSKLMSGSGNSMFGVKRTQESIDKRVKTFKDNFAKLSNRRTEKN